MDYQEVAGRCALAINAPVPQDKKGLTELLGEVRHCLYLCRDPLNGFSGALAGYQRAAMKVLEKELERKEKKVIELLESKDAND